MTILALDLGSTSFKAALFTHDLQRIGEGEGRLTHVYPGPGQVELPVDEVTRAFTTCVGSALGDRDCREITAVAITSQAQTFTVVNAEGTPRTPFYSWQDARALPTCDALRGTPFAEAVGAQTSFNALLPSLQLAMLLHLTQEDPTAPTDRVMPLPAYLVSLLNGQAYCTDANLAGMSGLYAVPQGDWWAEALAACGLTRAQLPALVDIGAVGATTADEARVFGIAPGVPVILAGNDQTTGAYGAEVHARGGLLVTLGTALVAYRVCNTLPAPLPTGVSARGPYPGGRYYQLTTDSCGGNVLTWAAQALGFGDDYPAFFALARTVPVGKGPTFMPDLLSGAGAWHGLGLQHTRADLARAVVDALSARVVALVRQLHPAPDAPILVAGGGSRLAGWCDELSTALSAPLLPVTADPLLGAARMALQTRSR